MIGLGQVVTCVPCDMLGMSVNVGSQETAISIYHSGQSMTSPDSENIFMIRNIKFNNLRSSIAFGFN